jgi:hypothetical protein
VDKNPKTGEYKEHNRTREMLLNAQFYCQPPRFFDDPHDAQQGAKMTGSPRDFDKFFSHVGDVFKLMGNRGLSSVTRIDELNDSEALAVRQFAKRKHQRRNNRVLSLSGDPTSQLMWSFYADEHRGICLCFDSEHPFFAKAQPMHYVTSPADIEAPTDSIPENDPLLYCKGRAWEWQHEWRLVWAGEEPRVISFPKDALKFVILGECFPHVRFSELAETLEKGGYNLKLIQMERLPDSFNYRFVPLWVTEEPIGRHSE